MCAENSESRKPCISSLFNRKVADGRFGFVIKLGRSLEHYRIDCRAPEILGIKQYGEKKISFALGNDSYDLSLEDKIINAEGWLGAT